MITPLVMHVLCNAMIQGLFVLHLSTIWYSPQDICDENTISPEQLQLSMSSEETPTRNQNGANVMLKQALRALYKDSATVSNETGMPACTLWYCFFDEAVVDAGENLPANVILAIEDASPNEAQSSLLHLHTDAAHARAQEIFSTLCPGAPFLPKSASAANIEQEESAEDAAVLASAKLEAGDL